MATTNIDMKAAEDFLRSRFPRGAKLLCAVSGGLDSMCLLHFCLERGYTVTAAHFNHRLRGENALRDQKFVEDWCAGQGIPCLVGSGDTRRRAAEAGESIEEAARVLRYAFLEQAAGEGGFDAILTAHHADDNAETVLLNLLRGTGMAGLGGIPAVRGNIYRPFLSVERQTLAAYAAAHGIPHVEDETNEEEMAARNLLRRRVLPVLRDINPRAAANMSRATAIAAEENALLEAMAAQVGRTPKDLLAAPPALAGRAALQWLEGESGGRKDLTAAHAQALLALCRKERGEAWFPGGLRARKEGEGLTFSREGAPEAAPIAPGQRVDFGPWEVVCSREDPRGWAVRVPRGAALTITRWDTKDRMTLPGSRGGRSVKRLCADRGIPPWERDRLPVLRAGEKAVAVARLGVENGNSTPDDETVYINFVYKGEIR